MAPPEPGVMLQFHRRERLGKVIRGEESAEQEGDGRETVVQEAEPDPEAGGSPASQEQGCV